MVSAGIDIGSRTVKLVLIEDGKIIMSRKSENSFNVLEKCDELIGGVEFDNIMATGYGRHLFAERHNSKVVSEITAFATGSHHLYPSTRTILDIGGQDTKAISLDERGKIRRFEMNDRCAAGTGRFLEIMAMALGLSLDEFGDKAFQEGEPEKINNMCTVFAESEVVSLTAKGVSRTSLAKGIMQSVVNRSIGQMKKVGIESDIVFVGGVALNKGMVALLRHTLGVEIHIPEDPQIVGALGAALILNRF
ncbi:MAG: acyl-CoA dehydratase activase [Rikenellaceae bacterium]